MPKSKPTPIIEYRDSADTTANKVGQLHVHIIKGTLGAQRVLVPEHAIFLLESNVTTQDVWQGVPDKSRQWDTGDVAFLPGGTDLTSKFVSRIYSETIIRVKDSTLRDVARGDIDYEALDLRYQSLPKSHVFGVCASVRNLAVSEVRHDGFDMLIEALTNSLSISVLLALSASRPGTMDHSTGGLCRGRKKRALDFIDSNLSQPITLADIASAAALSPYHFTRSFSAAVGMTPMRYVWARRTALAKRLMLDHHMPLSDVAHACGFSSQSHFTTAFKQSAGMTPAAWRRVN